MRCNKLLILLILFPANSFAMCYTDVMSGDVNCQEGQVTYVYSSPATLAIREEAQRQADAITKNKQEKQALIEENMKQLSIDDLEHRNVIDSNTADNLRKDLKTLQKAELIP